MSDSTLSFVNSSTFRNSLLAKNLEPYDVPGVYTPPGGPQAYETVLSSLTVIGPVLPEVFPVISITL